MRSFVVVCVLCVSCFVESAEAKGLEQKTVSDAYNLLNKLDDKQKAQIIAESQKVAKKLTKMDKEKRKNLEKRLNEMAKSLGLKDFDVKKLKKQKSVKNSVPRVKSNRKSRVKFRVAKQL